MKGLEDRGIPKMWFVKKGSREPLRVPHGDIGGGGKEKGAKNLLKWLKENSSP